MFIKGTSPETFATVRGNQAIGWTDPTEVHPSAPSRKPQDAETQMRMAYLGSSLRPMIAPAR